MVNPLLTACEDNRKREEGSQNAKARNEETRREELTSNCLRYPKLSRNAMREVKLVLTVELTARGMRS